ncbi:isoprenoid synthase domain-containing protein, partial [Mycena capillaripes]
DVRHYRVACDLISLLFILDDLMDLLSAPEVQEIAALSLDALRNWEEPRPQGERRVGEIPRRLRLRRVASAAVLNRFIANYDIYFKSVTAEAHDRDHKNTQSLDWYLVLCRETEAVKSSFDLLLLSCEIPGDILADSSTVRLRRSVSILSDISFNVEHARSDTHNAVIVVMKEQGLSIQEAMDIVSAWYRDNIEEFCVAMRDLPACSSVTMRNRVKMYFAGIANWVTGNFEWSLRSGRFVSVGEDPVETASGWVVPLMQRHKL